MLQSKEEWELNKYQVKLKAQLEKKPGNHVVFPEDPKKLNEKILPR